jgi:hypothetical protein
MLPGYSDCTRRAVAKQFKRKFQQLGYEFKELPPSVGSSVGTAVHASTAALNISIWRKEKPNVDAAVEMALVAMVKELSAGCIWDDTTPNMNTAQLQVQRMTECYTPRMPFTINGAPAVEIGGEQGLTADCGDGWILTGHPDLIDCERFLEDTKTGSVVRPYQGQLGGYSLLVRSNQICELAGLGMRYIPRLGKTKFQTPPIFTGYSVAPCERNAMGTINRIKADMKLFDGSISDQQPLGDLDLAFPCNQSSMMCSPKYCPAMGTAFCELAGSVK